MIDNEPMTDTRLAAIIKSEIDRSDVNNTERLAGDRSLAEAYYHSRELARGKSCDGFSNIVTADVSSAIDNALADMLPAYAATDLQCQFEPSSAQDEEAAEQESLIVSKVLMDGSKGFSVLRDALFDCLLLRNCVLKVSFDDAFDISLQEYDNVQVQQLAAQFPVIMQPDVTEEQVNAEMEKQGMSFAVPPEQNEDGTLKFTIRKRVPVGRPIIECFELGNFKLDPEHDSIDVSKCRFSAQASSVTTQSDLIEMGVDPEVADAIPDYQGTLATAYSGDSADRSTRFVEVYEVFIRVDYDGDGIAELRRVVLGGDSHILMNTEVSHNQFVTGSTFPMPHQWEGISLFDRLKEIEDASTTLMRQTIDNNENANLQRTIGDPKYVELEDLAAGVKRGFIRSKKPMELMPMHVTPLDQSTPLLMEKLDRMRSERAGSSTDMSPQAMPIGNETAHGIERVMSKMEAMTTMYVENFSDTVVRELYLHIHRLMRQHGSEMSMKVGNEYINVDPSQWPERTKLSVIVGSGLAEQTRKSQAYAQVLMAQKELMAQGIPWVTQDNLHAALTASSRANGIDYPDAFFVDPSSDDGKRLIQQAQQKAQQAKQEQEQKEMHTAMFQKALVEIVEQTKREAKRLDMENKIADRDLAIEKEMNDMVHKATELELVHDTDVPASAV